MRGRLGVGAAALTAALAIGVAALAFASWRPDDRLSPPPRLELSAGQLQLAQSAGDRALVRLRNARPGQRGQGRTTVGVFGSPAELTVRATNRRGVAGVNGGRLIASGQLWISVACVVRPCGGTTLAYRGPLRDMGIRSLGVWQPGTRRTYRARLWLRRGGPPPSNAGGDNAFQGSRATFGLVWNAIAP